MPCKLSLSRSAISSSLCLPSVKVRRNECKLGSGRCTTTKHAVRSHASSGSITNTNAHHTASTPCWLGSGLATSTLAVCLALQLPTVAWATTDASSVGSMAVATTVLAGSDATAGPSRVAAVVANTSAPAPEISASNLAESSGGLQTVYFGNGCFWGRQKDFVDVETRQLRRSPDRITALVGYAAGTRTGPGGKVCYVYSDPRTHYDALGHAEVVQLGVSADPAAAETEVRAFAAQYFEQFKKTPGGMQRSDPQDRGSAYRNVIGVPGGIRSPLFNIIQEENKYGMVLLEGRGNDMSRGRPTEDDVLNIVWVVDSDTLPFYRAERFHQFHHGLGKLFPLEYVRDLRNAMAGMGRIEPTGCPELPF